MLDLQVAGSYPVLLVQKEDLAFGAKCDGNHITAPTAEWTDSALPRVCRVKRYRPNAFTADLRSCSLSLRFCASYNKQRAR